MYSLGTTSPAHFVLITLPFQQLILSGTTSILIIACDIVSLLLTFLYFTVSTCQWANHSCFRHSGYQHKVSTGSRCGGALIEASIAGITWRDEKCENVDTSYISPDSIPGGNYTHILILLPLELKQLKTYICQRILATAGGCHLGLHQTCSCGHCHSHSLQH